MGFGVADWTISDHDVDTYATSAQQHDHMGIHMEDNILIHKDTITHLLCSCYPPISILHIQVMFVWFHHQTNRHIQILGAYTP